MQSKYFFVFVCLKDELEAPLFRLSKHPLLTDLLLLLSLLLLLLLLSLLLLLLIIMLLLL